MLRPGMVLDGRFKILKVIGRGGTSCVYLAEHLRLHNYWAIKEVFRDKIAGVTNSKSALIAESDILTKLNHPGLPKIIDILDTPESFLIVMEYIEGVSLDKVLMQRGALPQSDVLKWGMQICDVLDYLHSQVPAIIYRDMKPANIMLKPNGDVVLIDFGMAREHKVMSQHDTTNLGTHGYAAPEQYKLNAQTDARTDIYSLGVTLYHLVTGCDPCLPPYGLRPVCSVNASLSPRLDGIISRCTQIDPALRYQHVRTLKAELESVASGKPNIIPWEEQTPPSSGKKPVWLFVLIPVLVVAVIGIVVAVILGTGSSESGDELYYVDEQIEIAVSDDREFIEFQCKRSGYYIFETTSDSLDAPVIWVSDSKDIEIASDNTKGQYEDAQLRCYLESGETYIVETTLYNYDPDLYVTGRYWVSIYLE